MLASDVNNPEFVNPQNPDRAHVARFYIQPVKNEFESQKQGRPIFSDVEYVEIFTPGSQLNIIQTPAREDHKARFPREYAHFQNKHGGDPREVGTPLSQWPLLTASTVEELRGIKFFTVDSIANASDAMVKNIGMIGGMDPFALRTRAQRFLQAAKCDATMNAQAQELEALKEAQEKKDRELEELRAQVAALAASVQTPQPKKRGRKPKQLTETV